MAKDETQEPPFTAWHVCLVQLVKSLTDPAALEVRDFDKLGTLPLEADIILLRKTHDIDLAAMAPDLDFLLKFLILYMVVEFKSPEHYLSPADLDVVRAYALLCKRKYKIDWDRDVCISFLYSHVTPDFFDKCEQNGYPFQDLENGIRVCDRQPFKLLAIDLVALGTERPDNLINLVSARHRQFGRSGLDQRRLAIIDQLRYLITRKQRIHGMPVQELPGYEDLKDDLTAIRRRFMQNSTPEERLEGMSPEEVLRGLSPGDLVRALGSEDLLRRLSPEDLDRLEALLRQRKS